MKLSDPRRMCLNLVLFKDARGGIERAAPSTRSVYISLLSNP